MQNLVHCLNLGKKTFTKCEPLKERDKIHQKRPGGEKIRSQSTFDLLRSERLPNPRICNEVIDRKCPNAQTLMFKNGKIEKCKSECHILDDSPPRFSQDMSDVGFCGDRCDGGGGKGVAVGKVCFVFRS